MSCSLRQAEWHMPWIAAVQKSTFTDPVSPELGGVQFGRRSVRKKKWLKQINLNTLVHSILIGIYFYHDRKTKFYLVQLKDKSQVYDAS